MLKKLITAYLAIALALIAGCKDPTYSAKSNSSQIDSFVELLYETPEAQRKTFFELYTFYTLPYANEQGKIVTPDIHKLDGLTAKQVMKVISDHYDMVDYQSQHNFQ